MSTDATSPFAAMKYGPMGEAVERAMPTSEADPIGVWAAALSLYSSAISRTVRLENGRPVVVWTVLAGRSAIGRKGYALGTAKSMLRPVIGGYLDVRLEDGIASGASLVQMLYRLELETSGSRGGPDGRACIVEEEWASVLRMQKRDTKFSTLFRSAWDGKTISNRTKKELQIVPRPLLGFHAHITPGEWAAYVSKSDALGGSYNRLLPVLVERSKMLPHNNRWKFGDAKPLANAFQWATATERVMVFDTPAGKRYDVIRAEIEDRMVELPELLASYMERAAEQVHRIAAVLAATEKRTKIPRKAVDAAWAFVQYSMASVEKLVKEAAESGSRPLKTIEDLIRDALARYGGEATSTLLLRALGTRANAAAVKEAVEGMEDVEVYKAQTVGRGAKPIMYRLVEPAAGDQTEESPTEPETVVPSAAEKPERKATRPTLRVVRPARTLDPVHQDEPQQPVKAKPVKPLPKKTKKKAKPTGPKKAVTKKAVAKPKPAPAPAPADVNPIAALL